MRSIFTDSPVMFAVRLRNNAGKTNKDDQICDIGEPFEECKRKAVLYTQTSYYQTIDVIELNIVNSWKIVSIQDA